MELISVRRIDELGRIALPIEFRKAMGLADKDTCTITCDGQHIVVAKAESSD